VSCYSLQKLDDLISVGYYEGQVFVSEFAQGSFETWIIEEGKIEKISRTKGVYRFNMMLETMKLVKNRGRDTACG